MLMVIPLRETVCQINRIVENETSALRIGSVVCTREGNGGRLHGSTASDIDLCTFHLEDRQPVNKRTLC